MRNSTGGIQHAEVEIGDSRIRFGEAFGEWKPMPTSLYLYVPDCDAAYQTSLAAGVKPLTPVAQTFYGDRSGGVIRLSARQLWEPVFGSQPGILERIRAENPADLLCGTNLRPGELNLYVGYGARDHLNMAAHAESFAWLARQRGVTVTCHRDEEGGHDRLTLRRLHRAAYPWLAQQLLW